MAPVRFSQKELALVDELWNKLVNGAGMSLTETEGVTWTTSKDGSKFSCLDIHLCNHPEKVKSVEVSYEFTKDHQSLIMMRSDADTASESTCTKRKWDMAGTCPITGTQRNFGSLQSSMSDGGQMGLLQ